MSSPLLSLRSVLLAALLLLLSAQPAWSDAKSAATSPATASSASDVVTLTDGNFDGYTASGSWLVEFYAPWCGHCKALAPVWEKAATALRSQAVRLGKVDCTEETAVAKRHGIRGYPTIKFIRDGVARPYTGGRSLADITAFAQRMSAPPVREVRSEEEVTAAVAAEPAVFVLLSGAGTALHKTFSDVAFAQQGQAAFLHFPSAPPAALAQYGAQPSTPTVAYLSRGQEQPEVLQGAALSSAELGRFVASHRLPLVSALSPDNFEELTGSGKKLALLVLPSSFASQASTASSLLDSLYPLARRYRDSLHVATADASKYQRWLQAFVDTTQSRLPALVVLQDYPDTVYKPDAQPQGEADIAAMLTEVMSGQRVGKSSTEWYSPQRYLRPLNRWLLQFDEWQIIAAVVAVSVLVLGGVVLLTTYCMGDGAEGVRAEDLAARAKAAAGRAEAELKQAAQSDREAAQRLAASAEKPIAKLKAAAAKQSEAAKSSKKEDEDEDEVEEDGEDEIVSDGHDKDVGPTKRRGKSAAAKK